MLALLMLVVIGAMYGLLGLIKPVALTSAAQVGPAGRLTVTSAMIGCPAPGSAGTTGGGVAIANVPAAAGAGQETITRLNPDLTSTPVTGAPRPGQLTVVKVKSSPALPKKHAATTKMAGGLVPTGPARGGLIISATDANAQGLDVEQL